LDYHHVLSALRIGNSRLTEVETYGASPGVQDVVNKLAKFYGTTPDDLKGMTGRRTILGWQEGVAANTKRAAKAFGFTMAELVEYAGVISLSTLSSLCRGHTPKAVTVRRLASWVGCTPWDLQLESSWNRVIEREQGSLELSAAKERQEKFRKKPALSDPRESGPSRPDRLSSAWPLVATGVSVYQGKLAHMSDYLAQFKIRNGDALVLMVIRWAEPGTVQGADGKPYPLGEADARPAFE